MAMRIVTYLGGYLNVAGHLGIPKRNVRAWYLHGIPAKYHNDIMMLGATLHKRGIITIENLQLTCREGKQYRARLQEIRKGSR